MLLAGNVLQGVGFVAYLFSDSFVAVTVWTVVVTVGRTAFWGSYGNIVAAISVPGEREKWFGFLGALRNVGFALGGLVSGLAITIGTQTAYAAVVIANAVSYAVAFVLLLAVPATERGEHGPQPGSWATVLRDRPYRVLWFAQFAYSMSMMVLNFAMPVYATTVLGLPGWVTGAVFTINTIMVGFGQGLVVRRDDRPGPLADPGAGQPVLRGVVRGDARRHAPWARGGRGRRAGRLGGLHARRADRWPGDRGAGAEAAPDHLRGRYLSLIQLAWNVSGTVAPVTFAWLLDRGATPLWFALLASDPGRRGGLGAARPGAAAGGPAGHQRRPSRRSTRPWPRPRGP